ncbi:OmpA family protein [Marinomonas sp. C2222]|uniref:OmpA family protein n=1 Tax=Marinomonas sargassi TaxID=2984494 RepID=A0ABT2YRC7_9GAMM|nr:OmpA family protein [Marinomonas sargassi]MCV2402435.1 OmpA family protein [Marinomonas sargassi]
MSSGQTIKPADILSFYKDSDLDGVIDLRDLCAGTPLDQDIDYEGCPIIHLKQFFVHFDVQFETAKHELKPEYYSELKDFAQFLNQSPDNLILIEGHTDNVGEDDFNIPLSERRAESIAKTLESVFNIPKRQIRAIGHGENQPITSNLTEAGRQENRRVSGEIIEIIPWPSHILSNTGSTEHNEGKVIIPFSFTESLKTYQNDTLATIQQEQTQSIIRQIVTILDSQPDKFLLIEGHTDNTGEEDFNNRVSKARAKAVADAIYDEYFILKAKLKVIGHGQSSPLYSNETEEGRVKNRRVEIILATRHQAEKQVYLQKWDIWNVGEELPFQEVSEEEKPKLNPSHHSPAFWNIMN